MGVLFLRVAGIYFVLAFLFSIFVGVTEQLQFSSVEAHFYLLGWVSLALSGIIYYLFPAAEKSMLSKVHFWFHNIGLPIFLVAHYLEVAEVFNAGPIISTGAMLVLVGIILFAINVLINVRGKAVQ
jgi:cbb3-type cytochrome oxidase subunit 1